MEPAGDLSAPVRRSAPAAGDDRRRRRVRPSAGAGGPYGILWRPLAGCARRAIVRTPGATVTEILTESFCERCGTRYTFESNARRRDGLRRIRLLSRGVKHFVENDGSTVSEALEAARGDLARAASAEQIDAFHRTFNFCLGCRQYTCTNCWNAAEGACLSCAPDLSREVLPAPFPDLPLHPVAGTMAGAGDEAGPVAATAWPTIDVQRTGTVAAGDAEPAPEAPVSEVMSVAPAMAEVEPPSVAAVQSPVEVEAPEPGVAIAGAESEALAATGGPDAETAAVDAPVGSEAAAAAPSGALPTAADRPASEPSPIAAPPTSPNREPGPADALTPDELALVAGALAARSAAADAGAATGANAAGIRQDEVPARDHTAMGRAQTRTLLHRFRPARSSAAMPDWRDPAGAPPASPSTPAAERSEPATPTRAPVPVAPSPSPVAATPPPRDDLVPQPTWSRVAPIGVDGPPGPSTTSIETPPAATPLAGRVGPRPVRTVGNRPGAAPASPWAARLANARPESGVWAEASRDLLAQPGSAAPVGIQACVSCGLPLSATARFCRRCGASQG